MFNLPKRVVIFDTEYTAWEGSHARGWNRPGEYKEIVQIGALKVDTELCAELDSFVLYVQPAKNPVLSAYLTNLTGITQEDIETRGVPYRDALKRFYDWSEGLPLRCWGSDVAVMAENARLLSLPFPFLQDKDTDIRSVFVERGIDAMRYTSGTIPEAFGEVPPPHAHDALNDARSILQALQALAKQDR